MKNKNKKKKKKTVYSIITRFLVAFSIIGVLVYAALFSFNYIIGDDEVILDASGNPVVETSKKTEINALVCGTNQNLTDTMVFVRYNVETGKIAMMSIPRDTYVTNEYCIGHKLNAIYRGKNIGPLVEQIEELIGADIDYYLVFDSEMLINMVDALGGVEVNVQMRMKYDDPSQDLHIDLYPGVQVLNGQQAEMFVRFRHNNDMTVGYAMGDLDRTEVQQEFIKQFIKTVVDPKNIGKIPELINIAMENTDTNVTVREALKYVTDAAKIDVNSIESMTAPGTTKYIDNLSYFILDEEETQRIIKEEFNREPETTTPQDGENSTTQTNQEETSNETNN